MIARRILLVGRPEESILFEASVTETQVRGAAWFACAHFTAPLVAAVVGAVTYSALAANKPANDRQSLPRPRVLDSLGVRVVEYDLMPPPSPVSSRIADPFAYTLRSVSDAFLVSRAPFITIGGQRSRVDEELESTHATASALLLEGGAIVVGDRTQLKFFRANGTLIRAVGRRGRGPREFTQTLELCRLRGDSILAFDYTGTASLWDSTGTLARTFARPTGRRVPGSCDLTGNYVLQDVSPRQQRQNPDEVDVLYRTRLVRPDGAVVRDLGWLPGLDVRGLIGRIPSIIPLPGGVLVGGARTFELRWLSAAGTSRQIVRLTRRPLAISPDEVRASVERSIPNHMSNAERDALIRSLSHAGFPTHWPAHSAVRMDAAGRVWVADFESNATWTVFSGTGLLVGRVDLGRTVGAHNPRLLEVGRDYLAIAHLDVDGALIISYHRISLRGG